MRFVPRSRRWACDDTASGRTRKGRQASAPTCCGEGLGASRKPSRLAHLHVRGVRVDSRHRNGGSMSDEEAATNRDRNIRSMAITTFKALLFSSVCLAASIYDASRAWIAAVATCTALLAVFFGFMLGLSSRGER